MAVVGRAVGLNVGNIVGFEEVGDALGRAVLGLAVVGIAVGAVVGGPSWE